MIVHVCIFLAYTGSSRYGGHLSILGYNCRRCVCCYTYSHNICTVEIHVNKHLWLLCLYIVAMFLIHNTHMYVYIFYFCGDAIVVCVLTMCAFELCVCGMCVHIYTYVTKNMFLIMTLL